jgi:hypothetical protein
MADTQAKAVAAALAGDPVVHVNRIQVGAPGQVMVVSDGGRVALLIRSDRHTAAPGLRPGRENLSASHRHARAKRHGFVLQIDVMRGLASGTSACAINGENAKESPKGLNRIVGKKFGATSGPSETAPKPPDSPTCASRDHIVSLPWKRPDCPVSARKKPVSAKFAFKPPPKSSAPLKPNHEVVRPPLLTTD